DVKWRAAKGNRQISRLMRLVVGLGAGEFAPGYQMDVEVAQKIAEPRAGEKVEVVLPPQGAPGFALTGGGAHFIVVKGQMNHEFGDPGLKAAKSLDVEVGPFLSCDTGLDGDGVIDNHVARTKARLEVVVLREPIARNQEGQVVVVRHANERGEQALVGRDQAILMGIEVSGMDAHGQSSIDLGANLAFGVGGVDVDAGFPVVKEVAGRISQRVNFVCRRYGSPTEIDAF